MIKYTKSAMPRKHDGDINSLESLRVKVKPQYGPHKDSPAVRSRFFASTLWMTIHLLPAHKGFWGS
jgi:hypothetical protein